MNVFFYLYLGGGRGVTEILSVELSDQYNSFCRQIFTSSMTAELLLLNQENSYVMLNWWQLVYHDISQKSFYKIEFYRSENQVDNFHLSQLKGKRKHSF